MTVMLAGFWYDRIYVRFERGCRRPHERLLNHGEEGAGRSRGRHRRRGRRRCRRCWRGVGAARVRPLELYPVLHFAVVLAFLAVVGVLVAQVVAVRLVLRRELPRRLLVQLPDDVFWLHSKHISGQPASIYRARTKRQSKGTKKKLQRLQHTVSLPSSCRCRRRTPRESSSALCRHCCCWSAPAACLRLIHRCSSCRR